MPETTYAPCGDLSLAYQVFGDGPVELVFAGPFVSHLELFWTVPEFKAFFDQLATFCRIVVFDKAGVGLSDPVPQWTPSASEEPPLSVGATAARPP